jgi:transposase-like protein
MSQETSRRFSPDEKLGLVLRSYRARNVRGFCRRHGVDPATLYRWRRELARLALASWSNQRVGRPPSRSRLTVETVLAQLEHLLERHAALQ